MREDLWAYVTAWREKGIDVSTEEADEIYRICQRKMDIAGIKDPDEYVKILFPDELRWHLARRAINFISKEIMERRESEYVRDMQKLSMSSKVSKCAGTGTDHGLCGRGGRDIRG